jgi:D-gamma-glutamyl-meso-diaminopimelic acid endopeptidase CwlS
MKKEPVSVKPANTDKKEPSEAPAVIPATYTVQQDDTLWKIARRFKMSPEDVRKANGMKNNNIRPGQVLKLKRASKTAAKTASKSSNKKKPAQASASDNAAGHKSVSYTVQDGDTLWKIAKRFKVKPDEIKSWNSMKSDSIRPGDVLKIKVQGG